MQRNAASGLFTKPSIVNSPLIPVLFSKRFPVIQGFNGFTGVLGTYCCQGCIGDVIAAGKNQ
jgi:hypothetical protein